MRRLSLLVCAVATVFLQGFMVLGNEETAKERVRVSQLEILPIGYLGEPLGTKLVIEGKPAEKRMDDTVIVQKINGISCAKDVSIDLRDIPRTKNGVTYVLEGFESGAFELRPGWATPATAQQCCLHYHAYFRVTKIISPGE